MPDLLAQYSISYLIASHVLKPKHALVVALAGLLPDINALLRIHRSMTHSLVLSVLVSFAVIGFSVFLFNNKYLYHVVIVYTLLYVLHIVLDVFTGPTPLFWPVTSSSYMITLGINGVIGGSSIGFSPDIEIFIEPSSFFTQQVLYGPVVSKPGIIVAITTLLTLVIERLNSWYRDRKGWSMKI